MAAGGGCVVVTRNINKASFRRPLASSSECIVYVYSYGTHRSLLHVRVHYAERKHELMR